VRSRRVWIGLALAVWSGVVLAAAWEGADRRLWWSGGLLLLGAGLLVISGLRGRGEPRGKRPPPAYLPPPRASQATAPLLGQLLVNKYGLITERELVIALEQQRGTRRRLGQILVEMGCITESELAMVLSRQEVREDEWRDYWTSRKPMETNVPEGQTTVPPEP
jgi:hypothetical protein